MERTKRTVDELNELAKKITGVNPKAITDAQALNYIEQNVSNVPTYMYEVYENESQINEIDLTLKQLKEIDEKTNGNFLLYLNMGYGMHTWLDNIDLESGMISSSANNTTFYSTSDDEKFNEGE